MAVTRLAFLWGFAEATLFFVIPDAVVTRAALDGRRLGYLAVVAAILGALFGGAVSYAWGAFDLPGARAAVDWLPAISPAMMDRAQQHLRDYGMAGALLGSFVGIPYKLYAIHAASAGIGAASFLLLSIPVRAVRFVFLAWLTATLRERVVPRWSRRRVIAVWAVVWVINYAIYWSVMPN